MRVLIAEDEPRIAGAVARGLRREGMAVDIAGDGAAALYKARVVPYDVVVLDRDLPERARRRRLPHARGRAAGDEGADAHRGALDRRPRRRASRSAPTTTCPSRSASPSWSPACARSRAAPAPRGRPCSRPPTSCSTRRAAPPRARGRPLDLTPKEFAVLEVLLAAQGDVVTPDELVERAWDEQLDPLSNTVRMTVMTLRRKLGDPPLIETVRGSGYRV